MSDTETWVIRRTRDPRAPVRKRPRRVQRKIDKRAGFLHVKGPPCSRFMYSVRHIATECAMAVNRAALAKLKAWCAEDPILAQMGEALKSGRVPPAQ